MNRSHPPFLESSDTGQPESLGKPLGSFAKLLSLCWNVMEDPSENVAGEGGGEVWKGTIPVSAHSSSWLPPLSLRF